MSVCITATSYTHSWVLGVEGTSSSNLNDIHKTVKIPRSVRRAEVRGMEGQQQKKIDDIMNN